VSEPLDVLIVGAGPTGLTLAAQLHAFGTSFRLVDRQPDRVHESRALAVQPRTLEVLTGIGVAETMVQHGNPAVRLQIHGRSRVTEVPLFEIGLDDTRFPFLLFLSQAETETILDEHLTREGATVERGVELTGLHQQSSGVACMLRHRRGQTEQFLARYVVGCDGAHSTVRDLAGIGFTGDAYPQTFVLADLDADGPAADTVHVYLSPAGMLFLFPLAEPAPWRLLGMQPDSAARSDDQLPSLRELQALADTYTHTPIHLHDPVWATYFRLQHRHATRYRNRRVFLAGDAAHIHSPAGAQGMNTGIQDAWNLGWKLALVANRTARPALLDTYEIERQPVGRDVLRFTDRAFTIATSTSPLVGFLRTRLAPQLIRLAWRLERGRALGFRAISQLAISYRNSPASEEGHPELRRGPHAGDRLPDACMTVDDQPNTLHEAVSAPRFHLVLAGPPDAWPPAGQAGAIGRHADLIETHRLAHEPTSGALYDMHDHAHQRLGLSRTESAAHYLIRPDGHIAYRAAGTDVAGLHTYLARWLMG
jgi:2-polyprenyl-6-methoxyphenol hydroxylase-like FAD-dependent oxidoreductase